MSRAEVTLVDGELMDGVLLQGFTGDGVHMQAGQVRSGVASQSNQQFKERITQAHYVRF